MHQTMAQPLNRLEPRCQPIPCRPAPKPLNPQELTAGPAGGAGDPAHIIVEPVAQGDDGAEAGRHEGLVVGCPAAPAPPRAAGDGATPTVLVADDRRDAAQGGQVGRRRAGGLHHVVPGGAHHASVAGNAAHPVVIAHEHVHVLGVGRLQHVCVFGPITSPGSSWGERSWVPGRAATIWDRTGRPQPQQACAAGALQGAHACATTSFTHQHVMLPSDRSAQGPNQLPTSLVTVFPLRLAGGSLFQHATVPLERRPHTWPGPVTTLRKAPASGGVCGSPVTPQHAMLPSAALTTHACAARGVGWAGVRPLPRGVQQGEYCPCLQAARQPRLLMLPHFHFGAKGIVCAPPQLTS